MSSKIVNNVFISKPGDGQILVMTGLKLRVGSAQTSGTFELVEIGGTGSPLPHVHHVVDHCFYIIQGIFTFTLGAVEMEAPAGSVVFIPHGTPHAFKHNEEARALCFVIPAQMEGFFRELGEGLAAGSSEADLRAALAGKYDSWPAG